MSNSHFGEKFVVRRPNSIAVGFQKVSRRDSSPGINVDFAQTTGMSANWKDKSTIQLSTEEVALFCTVFLGLRDSAQCMFHGESRNKGISVNKTQVDKGVGFQYRFGLFKNGQQLAYILMPEHEAFGVYKLSMSLLSEKYQQTEQDVIQSLKAFYQ